MLIGGDGRPMLTALGVRELAEAPRLHAVQMRRLVRTWSCARA